MVVFRPLAQARGALLTLFVVSPLARDGGRRVSSSLCMASGSSAGQPGWASQIDESIKKNDVAHKNFGTRTRARAAPPADARPAARYCHVMASRAPLFNVSFSIFRTLWCLETWSEATLSVRGLMRVYMLLNGAQCNWRL